MKERIGKKEIMQYTIKKDNYTRMNKIHNKKQ